MAAKGLENSLDFSRSYHDGEHYNSVRLKDDPCDGPARSIVIKADADLSASSHQTKVKANKLHGQAGRETFQPGSVKLVMAGSGCENREKVEQILEQVNGDVGAAIEFLIAEQGAEECSANSDPLPTSTYGQLQKTPRNKVCPCGSKKKYKACCGPASGKQSANNQAVDPRKSKKESKPGKKGISAKVELPCEYDSVTPDMGALCI